MKVGILTFHNAHNWGAALQLYALKEYLKDLGHEVKVINYRNPIIDSNYVKNPVIKLRRKDWKGILIYLYEKINLEYGKKSYKEKWNKFNNFEKQMLDNDTTEYTKEDLQNLDIDTFICGSDQIWNPNLTGGLDEVYFCNFETNAKKISYAASMGIKELKPDDENIFKDYINRFDNISVREESLKQYIKKVTDMDVTTVIDPTLLLDVEKYDKIAVKPKEEKYLFLYTLIENKSLYEIAQKIAKERNLKIIELTYSKKIEKLLHNEIANIGPEEFLGYIKYADCVITNSFHGTIFSMLFQKDFYTINAGKVNSRIENVLNIAQIPERCIKSYEDMKKCNKINYENVYKNLNVNALNSKDFLNKVLN